MNRRPNQSRNGYESFSRSHADRFTASTPDAHFFDARRKKTLGLRLTFCVLALLAVILSVNFVVNRFIRVETVDIPVKGLSEAFDGFTILHISDLKGASFGSEQQRLAMALRGSRFDAAVLTGDMVSSLGNAQPLYALLEQLSALNPDAPVYFIAGDRDPVPASMAYATSGSPFAPWVLGAQQRGAQLLSSPQAIVREDQTLWLTASAQLTLDIDTMQKQFEQQYLRALESDDENELELAVYNLKWLEETRAARKAIRPQDVLVTLMHAPFSPDELDQSGTLFSQVDLLLSGHYLGGLIRLPLIGALFIPSQSLPHSGVLPGRSTHYGLHRDDHTWVYISPGLGSTAEDYPPFFFRLFNPPTMTLLSLSPSAL